MEKNEVGILIVFILGVFVIGFYGKLTGNVVNESIIECNVADFNSDGVVNYVDKEDFGEDYSLSPLNNQGCSFLDFNADGKISILDANIYNRFYDENYGKETGECVLRKLDCDGSDLKLNPKFDLDAENQIELPEEKPGFFKGIRNFFKNLFNR